MKLETKQDFTDMLFTLTEPIKKFVLPDKAGYIFGSHSTWYDDRAAVCEAFSRPLWGLAPYFAGGRRDADFEDIYLTGLKNGSDPESGGYFGDCRDRDQRFVEMAAIAYAMLLCPDILWEPLPVQAKNNLCAWLNQINSHDVCDSNWIFFRVLVNTAFKKRGRPEFNRERLEKDLARIDEFYIADGWYMDGVNGQKDYYIAFAIHFYSLIYAAFMSGDDPERCEIYKARAEQFAKTFIYWFADGGEALPYGRSLTYRFAQAAFWSACVIADIRPFSIGVMKGLITRNLNQWLKSDMLDNAGILTVGYKYPNLIMSEHYNAHGSPYWGLKVFAVLALPDSHEFFTAQPEPLPELDKIKRIDAADMLCARRGADVTAYPSGTHREFGCGQIIPKYLKFAYSTKFGFNVSYSNVSLPELAPDNMLVFEINGVLFTRNNSEGFELFENGLKTRWSAFEDIKAETEIIITETGHIRRHKITSPYAGFAYDCGFAVASRDADCAGSGADGSTAWAKNSFSACSVSGNGTAMVFDASPNTNIFYGKTVIPAVKYILRKGETIIETVITEE